MRRRLLPAVALGLALLLPTPTLACVRVPPKTWKGTIDYAITHHSVSFQAFTNNKCKWPHADLNGFDAIAFDVSKYRGLKGSVTWNTAMPLKPTQVFGYYRTSSCAPIQSWWVQDRAGQTKSFTFPKNAKWLIVQPVTTVSTKDIAVTIKSPGRKC